jgi:hypothetical protein
MSAKVPSSSPVSCSYCNECNAYYYTGFQKHSPKPTIAVVAQERLSKAFNSQATCIYPNCKFAFKPCPSGCLDCKIAEMLSVILLLKEAL